jgi:hypothetical protein
MKSGLFVQFSKRRNKIRMYVAAKAIGNLDKIKVRMT